MLGRVPKEVTLELRHRDRWLGAQCGPHSGRRVRQGAVGGCWVARESSYSVLCGALLGWESYWGAIAAGGAGASAGALVLVLVV